jgi:hypothetical protein
MSESAAHPAPGSPVEDYLDDLLRRTHADPRSTRRLLDEAADHLYATAAALRAEGRTQEQAEAEAIRRFGPPAPLARAAGRRSFADLVVETLRSAVYLGGCGLVAVGLSGLVALVMNLVAGRSFVGGHSAFSGPVFADASASVTEAADDAVVLRVLAGLVGVLVLLAYLFWRRYARAPRVLPAGLVDALGAAAFAAGTAVLVSMSVDQAVQAGTAGVGFALSGAVVALPATLYFCFRAARALLPARSGRRGVRRATAAAASRGWGPRRRTGC